MRHEKRLAKCTRRRTILGYTEEAQKTQHKKTNKSCTTTVSLFLWLARLRAVCVCPKRIGALFPTPPCTVCLQHSIALRGLQKQEEESDANAWDTLGIEREEERPCEGLFHLSTLSVLLVFGSGDLVKSHDRIGIYPTLPIEGMMTTLLNIIWIYTLYM